MSRDCREQSAEGASGALANPDDSEKPARPLGQQLSDVAPSITAASRTSKAVLGALPPPGTVMGAGSRDGSHGSGCFWKDLPGAENGARLADAISKAAEALRDVLTSSDSGSLGGGGRGSSLSTAGTVLREASDAFGNSGRGMGAAPSESHACKMCTGDAVLQAPLLLPPCCPAQLAEALLHSAMATTHHGVKAWTAAFAHARSGAVTASVSESAHVAPSHGEGCAGDWMLQAWRALSSIDSQFGARLVRALLHALAFAAADWPTGIDEVPGGGDRAAGPKAANHRSEVCYGLAELLDEWTRASAAALLELSVASVIRRGELESELLESLRYARGTRSEQTLLRMAVEVLASTAEEPPPAQGNSGVGSRPPSWHNLMAHVVQHVHVAGQQSLLEHLAACCGCVHEVHVDLGLC